MNYIEVLSDLPFEKNDIVFSSVNSKSHENGIFSKMPLSIYHYQYMLRHSGGEKINKILSMQEFDMAGL